SVRAVAATWVCASCCQLREGNRVDRLHPDAPGVPKRKRGAAIIASHFMDELEQLASDVREYATEVRRMGYSPAAGDEYPFLELSDRMIRRVDKLDLHTHSH